MFLSGCETCFRKLPVEEDAGGLLRELGLDRDYILAVGALEPRKNLPRLLKAFHILRENYRIPHVLALAGPKGWNSDGILEAIRELRLEQAVRVTGFVEDRTLNILYNRACRPRLPYSVRGVRTSSAGSDGGGLPGRRLELELNT